jgi:hypothetical protein
MDPVERGDTGDAWRDSMVGSTGSIADGRLRYALTSGKSSGAMACCFPRWHGFEGATHCDPRVAVA